MRYLGKGAAIAALVGLFLGGGAAHAQENAGNAKGVPDELRISFGAMHSGNARLRDDGSSIWGLVNVAYDFRHPSPSRLIDFAAYIDVAFLNNRDTTYDDGFRKTYYNRNRSFYGFGVQARVRVIPPVRSFGMYATGGMGLYNVARDESNSITYDYDGFYDDDGDYNDGDLSYTRNRSVRNALGLGYKFGIGIAFGRGLFVEGNYFSAGKLEDIRYNGYGLTFGLRL